MRTKPGESVSFKSAEHDIEISMNLFIYFLFIGSRLTTTRLTPVNCTWFRTKVSVYTCAQVTSKPVPSTCCLFSSLMVLLALLELPSTSIAPPPSLSIPPLHLFSYFLGYCRDNLGSSSFHSLPPFGGCRIMNLFTPYLPAVTQITKYDKRLPEL